MRLVATALAASALRPTPTLQPQAAAPGLYAHLPFAQACTLHCRRGRRDVKEDRVAHYVSLLSGNYQATTILKTTRTVYLE